MEWNLWHAYLVLYAATGFGAIIFSVCMGAADWHRVRITNYARANNDGRGGDGDRDIVPGSRTAEPLPSEYIPKSQPLRMTPELLAEIAFQQAAMLASRLSSREQAAFWRQVMKLAGDLPHTGETTYSK